MTCSAGPRASSVRVLIVDDLPVLRVGLAVFLRSRPGFSVVGEADDGPAAVESFRRLKPDVTVIDVALPLMSGIDVIRTICEDFPDARMLVFSRCSGDEYVYQALRAGARAYVLKNASEDELLHAIQAVHSGRRHICSAVAERLAERVAGAELTPREQEVLVLLARGQSNASTAQALGISASTVKAHVNNILGKLGVRHRTEAVTLALRRGLVPLD